MTATSSLAAVELRNFLSALGIESHLHSLQGFEPLIDLAAVKSRDGRPYTPNPERALVLYWLVRALRLSRYLEIGTSKGYSLLAVLKASADAGRTLRATSIDISCPMIKLASTNVERTFNSATLDRVDLLCGASEELLPTLQEPQDLVFVDGAHDAMSVERDGAHAMRLSPLVLFDDYNHRSWPGVVTACDALRSREVEASWMVIVSDRLLYSKALQPLHQASEHGMLLYDRHGEVSRRCASSTFPFRPPHATPI